MAMDEGKSVSSSIGLQDPLLPFALLQHKKKETQKKETHKSACAFELFVWPSYTRVMLLDLLEAMSCNHEVAIFEKCLAKTHGN